MQQETEMATVISSQRYRDQDIVESKIAGEDYVVTVSPDVKMGGDTYRIVIDGHHSYEAAKQSGNLDRVEWVEDAGDNCDYLGLCEADPERFLACAHGGDDWYDIESGGPVDFN
jgi:hypothetical protein